MEIDGQFDLPVKLLDPQVLQLDPLHYSANDFGIKFIEFRRHVQHYREDGWHRNARTFGLLFYRVHGICFHA
jgi:hypothetical protein